MLDVISHDYSAGDTDWLETVECWSHDPDIVYHVIDWGFWHVQTDIHSRHRGAYNLASLILDAVRNEEDNTKLTFVG